MYYNDFLNWQQPPNPYWTDSALWGPLTSYNLTTGPTRYLDEGALQKYLGGKHMPPPPQTGVGVAKVWYGGFDPAVWTCPSDDPTAHSTYWSSQGPYPTYPYSYTMNFLLNPNVPPLQAESSQGWMGGIAKMSHIRHASNLVMMLEECSLTINDGYSVLIEGAGPVGASNPNTNGADFLSVRHDRTAKQPDTPDSPPPLSGADAQAGFLNSNCRGNVVFADGHADYVTREFVHSPTLRHWDPAQ
jgi:prepilin-type processing-associated H-X9-DG protein